MKISPPELSFLGLMSAKGNRILVSSDEIQNLEINVFFLEKWKFWTFSSPKT